MDRTPVRQRLVAAAVAIVPFVGVWIGHTLEYARVWGVAGLRDELTGSVHAYMLPLGAALALLAAGLTGAALRVWHHLGRRLETSRLSVRRAFRGPVNGAPNRPAAPSWTARLLMLAMVFVVAQVLLYLLQENVEMLLTGQPAPGLGSVTGIHSWAIAEQALVALNLAAVVTLVMQRLAGRAAQVNAVERLVRALATRIRVLVDMPLGASLHPVDHDWVSGLSGRAPPVECAA